MIKRAEIVAGIAKELESLGFKAATGGQLIKETGLPITIEVYADPYSDKEAATYNARILCGDLNKTEGHWNFLYFSLLAEQPNAFQFTSEATWEGSSMEKAIQGPVAKFLGLIATYEQARDFFLSHGTAEFPVGETQMIYGRDAIMAAYILAKSYDDSEGMQAAMNRLRDYEAEGPKQSQSVQDLFILGNPPFTWAELFPGRPEPKKEESKWVFRPPFM